MASYQIKFARYNRKTCENRISGVVFHNADSFDEAYKHAETLRKGMAHAEPETDFRIVSILSHDFRGTDCEGGIRLWETAEEMRERIAAESEGPQAPPSRPNVGN